MRYELVDGDVRIINIMCNDGWKLDNTFPNTYPQPYFFALMRHDNMSVDGYDIQNVKDFVNGNGELNQWKNLNKPQP